MLTKTQDLSPVALLGRARELDALRRWLEGDAQGPLCVLGPAGVGKTRLVAEAAARWAPQARWVDLRQAEDSPSLLQALAVGLGVRAPQRWSDDLCHEGLALLAQAAAPLVIFDNAESLDEGARGLLAAWRGARPQERWWLTSQEALGLHGEEALPLQPLPTPSPSASPCDARHSDAVALLIALVRWRRGRFEPGEPELEALAEIARALGGLPLALSMAAGRMTLLEAGDVAQRLQQEVAFLRGQPWQSAHHATLHETLERSLARLSPPLRDLWCQAAVFHGGFEVADAEAILAAPAGCATLDALEELEQRSLLGLSAQGHLELYPFARPLARQEARRRGRWDEAQRRHAAWFARRGLERALEAPHDLAARAWIERAHANLQAALAWLHAQGERAPLPVIEEMIQAAIALHVGQALTGRFALSPSHFSRTLALARPRWSELAPRWRAHLLHQESIWRRLHGDLDRFDARTQEALALAQAAQDARLTAAIWNSRATWHLQAGAAAQALTAWRAALLALSGDDPAHILGRARLIMNIGVLELQTGDLDAAQDALQQAAAIFDAHHERAAYATALLNLALLLQQQAQAAAAVAHTRRAEAIFADLQHRPRQLQARLYRLHILAQCAPALQPPTDLLDAELDAARRLCDELQLPPERLLLDNNAAELALALHRPEDALRALATLDERARHAQLTAIELTALLNRGLALLALGRDHDAIPPLEAAADAAARYHNPLLHDALAALALARALLQQPDLALAALQRADAASSAPRPLAAATRQIAAAAAALAALPPDHDRALHALLSPAPLLSLAQHSLTAATALRRLWPRLAPLTQLQLLAQHLDPQGERLLIGHDGLCLRLPGADFLDLSPKPTLARLLLILATHPNGLHTNDLIEALYPDERLLYDAGVNRVHKTLSLLRRAGLKPWIAQHDGRYRLTLTPLLLLAPHDPLAPHITFQPE